MDPREIVATEEPPQKIPKGSYQAMEPEAQSFAVLSKATMRGQHSWTLERLKSISPELGGQVLYDTVRTWKEPSNSSRVGRPPKVPSRPLFRICELYVLGEVPLSSSTLVSVVNEELKNFGLADICVGQTWIKDFVRRMGYTFKKAKRLFSESLTDSAPPCRPAKSEGQSRVYPAPV